VAAYYPRKVSTVRELKHAYKSDFDVSHMNEEHEEWEEERKMYVLDMTDYILTEPDLSIVSKREERVRQRRSGQQKVRPL